MNSSRPYELLSNKFKHVKSNTHKFRCEDIVDIFIIYIKIVFMGIFNVGNTDKDSLVKKLTDDIEKMLKIENQKIDEVNVASILTILANTVNPKDECFESMVQTIEDFYSIIPNENANVSNINIAKAKEALDAYRKNRKIYIEARKQAIIYSIHFLNSFNSLQNETIKIKCLNDHIKGHFCMINQSSMSSIQEITHICNIFKKNTENEISVHKKNVSKLENIFQEYHRKLRTQVLENATLYDILYSSFKEVSICFFRCKIKNDLLSDFKSAISLDIESNATKLDDIFNDSYNNVETVKSVEAIEENQLPFKKRKVSF
jgi:hypothetical protein